jgi:hypothetical protein
MAGGGELMDWLPEGGVEHPPGPGPGAEYFREQVGTQIQTGIHCHFRTALTLYMCTVTIVLIRCIISCV